MTPEIVDLPEVVTATVRDTIPMTELSGFFDRSFTEIAAVLARQQITATGPAYARYFGQPADTVDVEVGLPVTAAITPDGVVRASARPATRAVQAVHEGSYDGLGDTWRRVWEWIVARGLDAADTMWEIYVTKPSAQTDPATLRTELYWPLRD